MTPLQSVWSRLVRFGFRLLYNEFAFTYDTVSRVVSLGQWQCWQRAVFDFIGEDQEKQILELAHGTGDLQRDLYGRGLTAIGVDLSRSMGRIARRKLMSLSIAARLGRCRAQALPFADRQFDTVLCTFPTPFIFEADSLREIRRVLKNSGRVVIVLNGMFTTSGIHIRLLKWLYRITGQRGAETSGGGQVDLYQPILVRVASFGFNPRLERVPCRYSEAYLIVADAADAADAAEFANI